MEEFKLILNYYISVCGSYNYINSYIENTASIIAKQYPKYLINKQSEDKIKAFLTDRVKAKVDTFVNAEAKNVAVTEVREIADLIAEYEGTENSSPYGSHPVNAPRWETPAWSLS